MLNKGALMENFIWKIPTEIYFGKNQISNLKKMKDYGKKTLIIHSSSAEKYGILKEAEDILKDNGISYLTFTGIRANPRIEEVREAITIAKENNVDMILAVGGGSVLDTSKIVAAGFYYEKDSWDIVIDSSLVKRTLPLFTVITLAATGSEMNDTAVISNDSIPMKKGSHSSYYYPVLSVLDPTYTFSVNAFQSACGAADIFAHTVESYFNHSDAFLQKRLAESIMETVVKYGPAVLDNPEDYTARSNLLWAGDLAINGLVKYGCPIVWQAHGLGHQLSAYYGVTHGLSLALIIPAWLEYILSEDTKEDIAVLGERVFKLNYNSDRYKQAENTINSLKDFFYKDLRLPSSLKEIGITDTSYFKEMARESEARTLQGYVPLNKEDNEKIYFMIL